MSSNALRNDDLDRGRRIRSVFELLFPKQSNIAIGEKLGYTEGAVRKWIAGGAITMGLIRHLEMYGISPLYLMEGIGDMRVPMPSKNQKGSGEALNHRSGKIDNQALIASLLLIQQRVAAFAHYLVQNPDKAISLDDLAPLEGVLKNLEKHRQSG